jgi:hypothetical protein
LYGRRTTARQIDRVFAQPFDENDDDVAAPSEGFELVRSQGRSHAAPVAAVAAGQGLCHGGARNDEGLGDLRNGVLPFLDETMAHSVSSTG